MGVCVRGVCVGVGVCVYMRVCANMRVCAKSSLMRLKATV